ncbi:TadE/TadG family type IV pilus assembly protein [Ruminiclostridium papyrosolvens]|uniref:Pilus biosynthesis protein TadE n=1 Tax=Ruminiclostridium papyrosolvens C7 TaxID=1330534 RepID=U4QX80_9FIRM|nr:TadE family protein [Ruminiclostridium papyrosolvens]EPR08277.1 pilus biosynthesis protein TadE [Ruminiclostridium papyrosolvens C7]
MKNTKGSFTVEASLVFSLVFLMVAAFVYIFVIMYQYVNIQSIADEAVTKGAYYYVNQTGEKYSSYKINELYWRIYDTNKNEKISGISNYVNKLLDKSILPTEKNISVNTNNKILMKNLQIEIQEIYPLPVGNMFDIFGLSPVLSLKAVATSPLDDNAEFIRNMDIVKDMRNCIQNSDNKWIGEDSQMEDIIEKLLKKK